MTKTVTKIFTIADFEEEEIYLREMHKSGWKLVKLTTPCFYTFESCEPEDVIYRLDFKNSENPDDYLQMLSDFGWEHFTSFMGWIYLRKPADAVSSEEEGELFSDNASKLDLVSEVIRKRMLPLAVIFLCAVLPNFVRTLRGEYIGSFGIFFGFLFSILFVVYIVLLTYCGTKLKKMRDRLNN